MTIGETIRKAIREISEGVLELVTFKDFKLTDDEIPDDLKYSMAPVKPKRARTAKGSYRGDDKLTNDINEAWVGGKAPKKKRKNVKKANKKR